MESPAIFSYFLFELRLPAYSKASEVFSEFEVLQRPITTYCT